MIKNEKVEGCEKQIDEMISQALKTGEVQFLTVDNSGFVNYAENILKKSEDVDQQFIVDEEKALIAIKPRVYKEDYNPEFAMNKADQLYYDHLFGLARKLYLNILASSSSFDGRVMLKIGLCHLNDGRFAEAKNYLSFAKLQCGLVSEELGLDALLEALEQNNVPEIAKGVREVGSEIIPDTFEVPHLHEVIYLILNEGFTLEEAAAAYRLSPEEVNKVRMLYAQAAYALGNIPEGDKQVEIIKADGHASKGMIDVLEEMVASKFLLSARSNNLGQVMTSLVERGI